MRSDHLSKHVKRHSKDKQGIQQIPSLPTRQLISSSNSNQHRTIVPLAVPIQIFHSNGLV